MNENSKKIIIPSCISIFVIAISLLGFTNVLRQTISHPIYNDWMKDIDDNTSLREVNMPGSHDTAALYSIGDLAGQCQSLSITDQLNLGVRFLDIRLQQVSNDLRAVHGIVDEKISMREISHSIEKFLENNPSEFLIMSVKEEADSKKSTISFEESLMKYIDKDIYLKERKIPAKVGDIRGKVVLLSRYANSTVGIEAYDEWKDSCSFTMDKNDIYVQDFYKIDNTKEKQDEIVTCFNETGHALKINFLSAYKSSGFPPSYAPSAAKDINPWINNEISKYNDKNIVLYDFVTEENMRAFFGGNN